MLAQHFADNGFLNVIEAKFVKNEGRSCFIALSGLEHKITGLQTVPVTENYRPFDGMLQLTDISRPVMFSEFVQGIRRQTCGGFAVLFCKQADEKLSQPGQIIQAFPQRGKIDLHRIDAV